MKDRSHASVFTATGIPSLFLIFSVLVLVILSLLTFSTSQNDLQTSRLSLSQTTAYYEACSQMTDYCLEAEAFLQKELASAADSETFLSRARSFFEASGYAAWDIDTATASVEIPFSETQALSAQLLPVYPQEEDPEPASCIRILSWNTVPCGTWTPDTRQPVFKGEP